MFRSNHSDQRNGADVTFLTKRIVYTFDSYSLNGSIPILVGCTLVVRAVRMTNGIGVRIAHAVTGAILLGLGFHQRRSDDGPSTADGSKRSERDESQKLVSDDTTAAGVRNQSQSGTNPRGVSDEPDVETITEPDEGDVRFTTEGKESRSTSTLDDEVPGDPRTTDTSEESDESEAVDEIDLSDAAMADEASEATGPTSEQAQPVQTEDTEPESSPQEDSSHPRVDHSEETDADEAGSVDTESSEPTDADADRGDFDKEESDENEDETTV